MKPIQMNEHEKQNLLKRFNAEFAKTLNDYTFQHGAEINFKAKIGTSLKEKIVIRYSASAYLRMNKLVHFFSSEVGWYGLIKKVSDKEYYVYDVLVPRQQVDGAKVDTDDDDMVEFFGSLTDEQADNMFFQAHSHVYMDTTPSGTDSQNQMDILSNIPGHKGFYLFQIWNKKGDVNSFLYDLDANTYYDKNDVELVIDDPDYGSLDEFISEVETLVEQRGAKKTAALQKKQTNGSTPKTTYASYPTTYNPNRYLYGVPDYDEFEEDDKDFMTDEPEPYSYLNRSYDNYFAGYYGGYY